VSPEAAARDYGVLVRDGALDMPGTEALRAGLRAARPAAAAHFDFGPEREAHERAWTAECYAAMSEIMRSLPTHWRFFVKTHLFGLLKDAPSGSAAAVREAFGRLREIYPGLAD
jgi:N-methylhydantoinase B